MAPRDLFDSITPSSRVTILTPQGHRVTGRVVMRGPAGWVLNLGGRHGRPGLATRENVVEVRQGRPRAVFR